MLLWNPTWLDPVDPFLFGLVSAVLFSLHIGFWRQVVFKSVCRKHFRHFLCWNYLVQIHLLLQPNLETNCVVIIIKRTWLKLQEKMIQVIIMHLFNPVLSVKLGCIICMWSIFLWLFCFSSGELDPERMGSGIQYGDAALRQLRSPRRAQAQSAQECGC